jgi:hypothetical protein
MNKTLLSYIKEQNNFSSVAIIRIVVGEKTYDYTNWKITNKKMYLFNEDETIGHILWLNDTITHMNDYEIKVTRVGWSPRPKTLILEIFYGGATF